MKIIWSGYLSIFFLKSTGPSIHAGSVKTSMLYIVVLCYYLVVRLGALYMQCIHIFHLKKQKVFFSRPYLNIHAHSNNQKHVSRLRLSIVDFCALEAFDQRRRPISCKALVQKQMTVIALPLKKTHCIVLFKKL